MTDDTPAPAPSLRHLLDTMSGAPDLSGFDKSAAPAPDVDAIMALAMDCERSVGGAIIKRRAALRAAVEHVCGMSKSWEGWARHYKERAERAEALLREALWECHENPPLLARIDALLKEKK